MSEHELKLNPWRTIWTEPRKTIRAIIAYNPKFRFIILSAIYAFPMLLRTVQNAGEGLSISLPLFIVICLLLSTFVGMALFSLMSLLVLWTGRWIGGQASYYEVRASLSWSSIPNLINIVIWIALLFLFRGQLFTATFVETAMNGPYRFLLLGSELFLLVATVWSIALHIITLSEVQKFSNWRALLNLFMPLIILIGLLVLLAWVVSGLDMLIHK